MQPPITADISLTLDVVFGRAEMEAFRELSGDRNPIHFDEDFARARGFAGPIVYGGLIVAAISRLLGEQVPGPGCVWHSLKLDFRSPLYVGEKAVLEARVLHTNADLGTVRLSIELRSGERLVASGSVQALLARARD